MFGKLTNFYFAPKFFEKSGRIYEVLGIRVFKRYIPSGDIVARKWRTKFIRDNTSETLRAYEQCMTRLAETAHLIVFFLMFGPTVFLATLGTFAFAMAGFFIFLNIMVNLYPIMLQRYNRARIYRILEKRNTRAHT